MKNFLKQFGTKKDGLLSGPECKIKSVYPVRMTTSCRQSGKTLASEHTVCGIINAEPNNPTFFAVAINNLRLAPVPCRAWARVA